MPSNVSDDRTRAAALNRGIDRRQIAEQLLAGTPPEKIAAMLNQRGTSLRRATRELSRVVFDPVFRLAVDIDRRRHKAATFNDALAEMRRQSPDARKIPVLVRPTAATFFSDYYFQNRPVVVRGLMRDWPARRKWTPEYFAREFGDRQVEVSGQRERDTSYDYNFAAHRTRIRLATFVSWLVRRRPSNDFYLTARNELLQRKAFRRLRRDFAAPPGFLNPRRMHSGAKLWLGPKGTITSLHHDESNILFGQVYGRKQFKLISPFASARLYNDRLCYSRVDLTDIDYRQYPLVKGVPVTTVVLQPGDFLFIPIGWWHWVKSLDASISLSFTNFARAPVVWDFRRTAPATRASASP